MVDISGRKETAVTTAPAWQVRNMQRQKLLEGIQQRIIRWGEDIKTADLHRIFLFLLNKQFALAERGINYNNDLIDIPYSIRKKVFSLFCEIWGEVEKFRRSKEEGNALLAKLFEWTAGEITRSYHSALTMQEMDNPKLIYGTERATDEIPFE